MTVKYEMQSVIKNNDWKTRIGIVFQGAIDGQLASDVLASLLEAHVYKDLDGKHENGLPLYSESTQKYVRGLVDQWHERLHCDHLEYCFLLDGVLYSTRKKSIHPLASASRNILNYRAAGQYWRARCMEFCRHRTGTACRYRDAHAWQ